MNLALLIIITIVNVIAALITYSMRGKGNKDKGHKL